MTGLIIAIDTTDLLRAQALVSLLLRSHVGMFMFKIGSQFFTAHGPDGVRKLQLPGTPWMLDLKWHDIPTTVAAAVQAAVPLRPTFVTINSGFREADIRMKAAKSALEGMGSWRPLILAVLGLTSYWDQISEMASESMEGGADGFICSAARVRDLKYMYPKAVIVCPGIRPDGYTSDDHANTFTPREAAEWGADWIVVGRPITQADNPAAMVKAITEEMR